MAMDTGGWTPMSLDDPGVSGGPSYSGVSYGTPGVVRGSCVVLGSPRGPSWSGVTLVNPGEMAGAALVLQRRGAR